MTRAMTLGIVALSLAAACGDTTAGRVCQPGDNTVCGDGFQCMTFCDKDTGPESICTPSFGKEAGDTFANEALIDDKVTFGQLGNTRVFDKNLRIEVTNVKGVALPLVEEVHGDLTVTGTDVECLSMPRLKTVDGILTLESNKSLVRAELDAVERAAGLVVTGNASVARLIVPSLTSLAGDADVSRNALLDAVDLASLRSVGGDLVMQDNSLSHLHLDALADVAGCVEVEFDAGACTTPALLAGTSCSSADVLARGTCD